MIHVYVDVLLIQVYTFGNQAKMTKVRICVLIYKEIALVTNCNRLSEFVSLSHAWTVMKTFFLALVPCTCAPQVCPCSIWGAIHKLVNLFLLHTLMYMKHVEAITFWASIPSYMAWPSFTIVWSSSNSQQQGLPQFALLVKYLNNKVSSLK